MRRPLLLLLKAAISILLLYLSLRSVNLVALGARLSRINIGWIAAALALLMLQVALLAFRWRMIAAQCGTELAFSAALRISFIASFFNQVLPSTVGGDAARIWMLARRGSGWARATYSVLIDRVAGVFSLALIVIACLPWTLSLVHDPIARTLLVLIGGSAVGGAFVLMAISFLRWPWLDRWTPTRHLVEVSRIAWRMCRSSKSTAPIGAISFSIHFLTIAIAWCAAQSVAVSVSFMLLLFLIPPVLLVSTVPISIAGWGVREGSMVVAFSYAGLAQSDGLIVSVLFGLAMFAIGLLGGFVWILGDARMPAMPAGDNPGELADGA